MFAYRLTEKHERTGIWMTKTRQCELNMRPLRFDHVGSTSKKFHFIVPLVLARVGHRADALPRDRSRDDEQQPKHGRRARSFS